MELLQNDAPFCSLNCIDLSSPHLDRSISLLKQACLDCGFFYVVNHGISEELMKEVFTQSKRFFELPLVEKMRVLRNEKHRGYTPILDELLDPDNQLHGDYKEGYYIGVEVPEGDPDADKPFHGQNVWPSEDILPGWRETMERYHREALEVGRAIARSIALALDLEADFFDKPEMLGQPIAIMRLLRYGGQISDPSKGLYGAGAHSDYGLITLLATDDVFGLQICKDKDAQPQKWKYVAPVKGALVVNLGDMLERWSNCIFKSTLHRVLGNGQERYSIAYFVEPSYDCLVECLPTCKSETNPPKFPPIKYSAYLSQRYKDTHANLSVYSKTLKQQAAEMKQSFFTEGLLDDLFTQLESIENEGNPNFVEESITLLFRESSIDIATVEELLEKDVVDLDAIWLKLRKIHASSGCIGAVTIARKAKEAMAYCQQQNLESFKVSFNEMKEEIDKMKGKLEAYLQLLKQARAGN